MDNNLLLFRIEWLPFSKGLGENQEWGDFVIKRSDTAWSQVILNGDNGAGSTPWTRWGKQLSVSVVSSKTPNPRLGGRHQKSPRRWDVTQYVTVKIIKNKEAYDTFTSKRNLMKRIRNRPYTLYIWAQGLCQGQEREDRRKRRSLSIPCQSGTNLWCQTLKDWSQQSIVGLRPP